MTRPAPRLVFLAVFLACAGLLAIALYLQEQKGLDPCPMCILQRYAFTAIGLTALAAAVHGPRGVGVRVYALLALVFTLVGGGTAIRQSWLQHNPPKSQSCGTDLEFLLENFPLAQALPKIFAGSGDCAAVHWRLLGLSIAEWALVWFAIFLVVLARLALARRARA